MMTIWILVAHPHFRIGRNRALLFSDTTCQGESCGSHVLY